MNTSTCPENQRDIESIMMTHNEETSMSSEFYEDEQDLFEIKDTLEINSLEDQIESTNSESIENNIQQLKSIKPKRNKKINESNNDDETIVSKPLIVLDPKRMKEEDDQIRSVCHMKCDICDFPFDIFRDCKTHYKSVHNMVGYLKCCDNKIFSRFRVVQHIQRHLHPNGFMYVV